MYDLKDQLRKINKFFKYFTTERFERLWAGGEERLTKKKNVDKVVRKRVEK